MIDRRTGEELSLLAMSPQIVFGHVNALFPSLVEHEIHVDENFVSIMTVGMRLHLVSDVLFIHIDIRNETGLL